MTNITRLSPGIILEIMELLDLSDICTLIKTSPLFLQHFLTHRHQLLGSTVSDLNHRLVGCHFSIFLSALRLRCRQSTNAPSSQSEVREAKQASLRLYRHQDARRELSTKTELGLIYGARQLFIELEWVTDSYAPKAWWEKQHSKKVKPVALCMDLLAQTEFMLDWFYTVSQSPDSLVLMVNGIDLHRKGTFETHPWQPWEGIEGQSSRSLAPWRRGSYFWDRNRIQSLGGIPF
ncbi:hypothetical protein LB507_010250 [Fusarium sp. FIESC RH6]|nr:hypothetical protein LB507_010250 [Fusarium sp. FIESC RH6]